MQKQVLIYARNLDHYDQVGPGAYPALEVRSNPVRRTSSNLFQSCLYISVLRNIAIPRLDYRSTLSSRLAVVLLSQSMLQRVRSVTYKTGLEARLLRSSRPLDLSAF